MAVEVLKSGNVTKYDAGGSGDNIILDGYVKAVEKVWIDSYTMVQTGTNSSINIAVLPANKKITSIDIIIETTASQTSGTVSIGFSTDAAIDTLLGISAISHGATATTISIPGGSLGVGPVAIEEQTGNEGFQFVTVGTRTVIALKLNNWTMSSGTIKSIVRYT